MSRLLSRQAVREILTGAALLCCALALVCWPREVSASVKSGLELCYNVIIPSLFPFFILTSLVISLGLAGYLGRLLEPVMRPLFLLGGSCAAVLALGFVGGYPVGARAALTLYESGQCSKTEAERLLAFCNNSGPAFILGVVGAGVFADSRVGVLLCLTHAAASICVGLLFRFYRWRDPASRSERVVRPIAVQRFSAAFTSAVKDALQSILNICAFVVCFTVIIQLCFRSGILPALAGLLGEALAPLGFTPVWAERLLTGALEISSGVWSLAGEGSLSGRVSMAAFMLGWAGVSVHCQVLSFLGQSGLNVRTYIGGKFLHGLISAALIAGLFRLFPQDGAVSSYLAWQVAGIAATDFHTALTVSTAAAWVIFLAFLAAAAAGIRKARRRT
ncbi:MAG: nucleoside recognition domain-containing protein [Clostridiales bacterium]|nr:nucleoside recognition domain-containing protein [Clostridiales bacterium]